MKAKALMSFSGYGITASNGEIFEITDEKVFLDLAQAGFVEQVDVKPTSTPRVEKLEVEAKAKANKTK